MTKLRQVSLGRDNILRHGNLVHILPRPLMIASHPDNNLTVFKIVLVPSKAFYLNNLSRSHC